MKSFDNIQSTDTALSPKGLLSPCFIYIYIWGAYDKFPDFFRMDIFIDSTHMKL